MENSQQNYLNVIFKNILRLETTTKMVCLRDAELCQTKNVIHDINKLQDRAENEKNADSWHIHTPARGVRWKAHQPSAAYVVRSHLKQSPEESRSTKPKSTLLNSDGYIQQAYKQPCTG